jgi:hypothetical protein
MALEKADQKAPRLASWALQGLRRGVLGAVCLGSAGSVSADVGADKVAGAGFRGETDVYQHCILGDCIEWSALEIVGRASDGSLTSRIFEAGAGFVFEDTRVRFWDITGDGQFEVVVILTSLTLGASLAIYDAEGLIAQTPHIGQTRRWLAPVGAADFDGDGRMEVAFVDRPHLAKTLRVFEWDGAGLVLDAELAGLTNHRIGENFISSGVRDCGAGPEMITARGDWSDLMVTRMDGESLATRSLGAYSPERLAAALECGF